jgi:hypothetical protein
MNRVFARNLPKAKSCAWVFVIIGYLACGIISTFKRKDGVYRTRH